MKHDKGEQDSRVSNIDKRTAVNWTTRDFKTDVNKSNFARYLLDHNHSEPQKIM
jgi:hypothetical protein